MNLTKNPRNRAQLSAACSGEFVYMEEGQNRIFRIFFENNLDIVHALWYTIVAVKNTPH